MGCVLGDLLKKVINHIWRTEFCERDVLCKRFTAESYTENKKKKNQKASLLVTEQNLFLNSLVAEQNSI